MPLSMTGCGDGIAAEGASTCRAEVRSVNNRFLKVSLRTREGFSLLESRVEEAVKRRVRRGAVQVSLDLSGPVAPVARSLDRAQLNAYFDQLEAFCAERGIDTPRAVDGLLSLPGILVESVPSQDAVLAAWPLVERALVAALDGLDRMRRTEGESLARDMLATCTAVRDVVGRIRLRVPAVVAEHHHRLHERVSKVLEQQGQQIAAADVAREIALLADRTDIAEEIVRLGSHLEQFASLLREDSPGRSLDFLSQELAREANTIGSKSADVGVAHAVVELKTHIERLREQVQNLE